MISLLDKILLGTFGLVSLVCAGFGAYFVATSIDLSSSDVPSRQELEVVKGEICEARSAGRDYVISLCNLSRHFVLRSESGRVELAAEKLREGKTIEMLVASNGSAFEVVLEANSGEVGLHFGYSSVRESYRKSEMFNLALGFFLMTLGVYVWWSAVRNWN